MLETCRGSKLNVSGAVMPAWRWYFVAGATLLGGCLFAAPVASQPPSVPSAEAQDQPETVPRETGKLNAETLSPSRQRPAVPFASLLGQLPRPVKGVRIGHFGGFDSSGDVDKGELLVTAAGAQVTAPCDGWVIYAGPYPGVGQVLILTSGDGYHVVMAGVEHISAQIGQFVRMGEAVATMGSSSEGWVGRRSVGRPVLYVEFRKDNVAIDPGPWWAPEDPEDGTRGR